MKRIKTVELSFLFLAFIIHYGISCTSGKNAHTEPNQVQQELAIIDSLLRDSTFAESMAKSLDSAYYAGVGQTPPEFLTLQENNSIVLRRTKDDKVATSIAGFYALECGVGLLSEQTNQTPLELLHKIVSGSADSNAILLLNRFANATWKAGQPFRGLSRITRYNFRVANLLSADEVAKDSIQIVKAATKLLASMDKVNKDSLAQQMQTLRRLLQDTAYTVEMASSSNSYYALSQNQKPTPFLSPEDDTANIAKSAKEVKIATSIAGFYALECALNYLVTTRQQLPSIILKSLINDSISKEDKMIFARFANATWKAGQPFRGLNRVTRPTFTPFYFLSVSDIEKDLVQVKAAAKKLLAVL